MNDKPTGELIVPNNIKLLIEALPKETRKKLSFRDLDVIDRYYRSKISADVDVDKDHGPIVRVMIAGHTVSVYLREETSVVTLENGAQYGCEVKGPWFKFRKYCSDLYCAVLEKPRQGG